ncbi:hypothetical protein BKA81DRAFT_351076 [Phyllosticta paracitricarpa]
MGIIMMMMMMMMDGWLAGWLTGWLAGPPRNGVRRLIDLGIKIIPLCAVSFDSSLLCMDRGEK